MSKTDGGRFIPNIPTRRFKNNHASSSFEKINQCKARLDSNRTKTGTNGFSDVCDSNHNNKDAASGRSAASRDPPNTAALGAPPDGGFGWVVVFSSFYLTLLVDGVGYSQGIFFDEFQTEFQTDNATTAWIGSVLIGTYQFVGPLVSIMVHVYGCRRVSFMGAILASIAFGTSTFCPDIVTFIFIYGLLTGIGFGMMALPAIIMVGHYFERRRALATGIACCGSGMGAFLFAPLSSKLIEEFMWKGATYILAGIILSGIIFALSFVPLETYRLSVTKRSKEVIVSRKTVRSLLGCFVPLEHFVLDNKSPKRSKTEDEQPWDDLSDTSKGYKDVGLARSRDFTCDDMDSPGITSLAASQASSQGYRSRKPASSKHSTSALAPLNRKDIFYSGDIVSLLEYKEADNIDTFRCEMSRIPSDVIYVKRGKWAEAFYTIFDAKLLKSPTFLLYGMSCFLCLLGFIVPFTYMPTLATEIQGVTSTQAAFLISTMGLTTVVARVAVGFISDLPCADCLLINGSAILLGGVATFFVPHFDTYWMFTGYSAVLGVSTAVFFSLRSIIMVELMGLDKLTAAFGFVNMFQGASSLVGAPIAGVISDHTGNYTYSFYMAGTALVLSGAICFPLRRVARLEGLTK